MTCRFHGPTDFTSACPYCLQNDLDLANERYLEYRTEAETLRKEIAKMETIIIELMPSDMFSVYLDKMNGLDK